MTLIALGTSGTLLNDLCCCVHQDPGASFTFGHAHHHHHPSPHRVSDDMHQFCELSRELLSSRLYRSEIWVRLERFGDKSWMVDLSDFISLLEVFVC